MEQLFTAIANRVAHATGKPITFIACCGIIVAWAISGPIFDFSDTWQLIINTGTTIITFLMVFLLQHSQNRDTLALQVKLADLIIAMKGADNKLATAEDLSEEELAELHASYSHKAQQTLEQLEAKRKDKSDAPPALDRRPRHRAS